MKEAESAEQFRLLQQAIPDSPRQCVYSRWREIKYQ